MLIVSVLVSLLFIILSQPKMYIFTNSLFKSSGIITTLDNCPGIPSIYGLAIHSVLFFGLTFLILTIDTNSQTESTDSLKTLPDITIGN